MAFTQQNLLDGIYSKISSAVSVPVYNAAAPENVQLPYIVYTLISDLPQTFFTGNTDDIDVRMQVDIYSVRDRGAKAIRIIAEEVKTALHKQTYTITNADGVNGWIVRRGTVREEYHNVFRIIQDYRILGSET